MSERPVQLMTFGRAENLLAVLSHVGEATIFDCDGRRMLGTARWNSPGSDLEFVGGDRWLSLALSNPELPQDYSVELRFWRAEDLQKIGRGTIHSERNGGR